MKPDKCDGLIIKFTYDIQANTIPDYYISKKHS